MRRTGSGKRRAALPKCLEIEDALGQLSFPASRNLDRVDCLLAVMHCGTIWTANSRVWMVWIVALKSGVSADYSGR